MPFAKANCNGKFWMFVKESYQVDIVQDIEQQMTIKIYDAILQKEFYVTSIYAKYDKVQ